MKRTIILFILVLATLITVSAQTKYTYTATKSGIATYADHKWNYTVISTEDVPITLEDSVLIIHEPVTKRDVVYRIRGQMLSVTGEGYSKYILDDVTNEHGVRMKLVVTYETSKHYAFFALTAKSLGIWYKIPMQ